MKILSNCTISTKPPIICTLLQSTVKTEIFITICSRKEDYLRLMPKSSSNTSWGGPNICILTGLSTEIWSQPTYWWKMGSAKSVTSGLPRVWNNKTLSWSLLSALRCTCPHKSLKGPNILLNRICGQLDLFTMRCSTVKLLGLLQTSFSLLMGFIVESRLSQRKFRTFLEILSWNA